MQSAARLLFLPVLPGVAQISTHNTKKRYAGVLEMIMSVLMLIGILFSIFSLVRDMDIFQNLLTDTGAFKQYLDQIFQIVITGGIAYDKVVVSGLKERAGFIAPITVYPGEDELLALAQGALRVLLPA